MIRPVTLDDAPAFTELLHENKAFLAPWMPLREESHFTLAAQQEVIERAVEGFARGTQALYMILDGHVILGRIGLSGITRGAFQSASISYWVGKAHNGRGLATSAVKSLTQTGFNDLDLHRLQGETLLHNTSSQRVLLAAGFVRYGTAPKYLKIAGQWQDHHLYQILCPDP